MRLALFASGKGSNVEAILESAERGELQANPVVLITDNPQAGVLNKECISKLATFIVSPKNFSNREEWEGTILNFLQENKVEFIVLAGFMRILGPTLLSHYPKKIINIHPSLLPKFPGRKGIEDAFLAGESETGITIHYVDEGIDTGEIIYQEKLEIQPEWTLSTLEDHIHCLEHVAYPKIINNLIKKISERNKNDE